MTPPTLFTLGYERATPDAVTERLKQAGVSLLIDVRAVAASRRPGFSKRALAAGLDEAGIGYVHLRALGTPKAGREAARAGRIAAMAAIYETHLAEPETALVLAEAIDLSRAQPCALLCFEADACDCHRRLVADRIRAVTGAQVVDL